MLLYFFIIGQEIKRIENVKCDRMTDRTKNESQRHYFDNRFLQNILFHVQQKKESHTGLE